MPVDRIVEVSSEKVVIKEVRKTVDGRFCNGSSHAHAQVSVYGRFFLTVVH